MSYLLAIQKPRRINFFDSDPATLGFGYSSLVSEPIYLWVAVISAARTQVAININMVKTKLCITPVAAPQKKVIRCVKMRSYVIVFFLKIIRI